MNKTLITELTPNNGRKSFYGKAKVFSVEGTQYLRSYDTIVASVDSNGKTHRFYDKDQLFFNERTHEYKKTHTTPVHIKSFIEQVSHDISTTKEFYALPLEDKPTLSVTL